MKKFTAYLLITVNIFITQLLTVSSLTASADGGYARIETDSATLFADASLLVPLFTLPKSYYVKVVDSGGEKTRVTYMSDGQAPAIEGYVRTVNISFIDITPTNPFPDLKLSVATDDILFSDPEDQKPKCVLSKGSAAVYYGETTKFGETFVYVYAKNNVGFVRKSSFSEYTLSSHPDYIRETAEKQSVLESASATADSISKTENSSADTSKVIIIALLIIGVLCIVFLLFKKEDAKSASSAFFRDDD